MPSTTTRKIVILLVFAQAFITLHSSTFIALDDVQTENKIYSEVLELKESPNHSKLLSTTGLIVANESKTPVLYSMTNKLAEKLSIPVPLILIFTGNPLSTAAEHCGIDYKCNAFAFSLAKNFGLICIGEDLIQCLSPQELEATIAHELSHIHHNHVPKKILLTALFHLFAVKFIEHLGLRNRVIITSFGVAIDGEAKHCSAFDLAPYILDIITLKFFSRYFENEADATAATIIDDPKEVSNAVFKIEKISNLKRRIVADTIAEATSTHPLTKHRAQNLAVLAQKNEAVL
jgi:Zn-dependent protease with chaperone function